MPTKKKRLNIILPKKTAVFLQRIALRDEVSQAEKVVEYVEKMLEIEEGESFSPLAESRDTPDAKFVSHEEAWKAFKN